MSEKISNIEIHCGDSALNGVQDCKEMLSSRKRPTDGITDASPPKKCPNDLNFFSGFAVDRTLNDDAQKKLTVVLGKFRGQDDPAIVILERKPFTEAELPEILCEQSKTNLVINNDIYSTREVFPSEKYSGIKASLIFPATEKHIAKYTKQESRLVQETSEGYKNITLPFVTSTQFSTTWVDNIMNKKTESERIVFEDPDKEIGFILLPDMKWDGKQVEDLYLVAIVHKKGIKSLRDLTPDHLPLLRNIWEKGCRAIQERYGLDSSQLRVYLHYQPSYYWLHVHFTHVRYDAPGVQVERAHLLTNVIQNIELCPDYYQRASLTFPLRVTDKLYLAFQEGKKIYK